MQKMINSMSYKLANRSIGLLLLRVAVGVVFIAHGWMKVGNMPMIETMFAGMGLPAWTAMFIAWLEVIGGIALILGVYTRVFAKLFAIMMLVAFFLTGGFATGYKPHELEIFLMLTSLAIMFAGSGRYALYSGECRRCGAYMCKMGPDNCPQMKG